MFAGAWWQIPSRSPVRQIVAMSEHCIQTLGELDAGINSIFRWKISHRSANLHVNWITMTKSDHSWCNQLGIMLEDTGNTDWHVDNLLVESVLEIFWELFDAIHDAVFNVFRDQESFWLLANHLDGFTYWQVC